MSGLDHLMFAGQDLANEVQRQLSIRSVWFWLIAMAPALILEGVPVIGCLVHRLYRFGRGRPDAITPEERAFIASTPSITILLVGYNEEAGVRGAIRSILGFGYPRLQLIVVDDGSTDGMAKQVQPFAERGDVLFVRNQAASGRGGKPSAVNFGALYATGEYIILLDTDTFCHPRMLDELLAPFHDPSVGAVGGNLRVGNPGATWLTRLQQAEYMVSIGVGRQWQQLLNLNIIASGACAAYRSVVFRSFFGCDTEMGEDLDNSLKSRKAGWRVVFASRALAWTEVPETLRRLTRQRFRWDRDLINVCLRKHGDLLWRLNEPFCWELWRQLILAIVAPIALIVYLAVMLWLAPGLLVAALVVTVLLYEALMALAVTISYLNRPEKGGLMRLLLSGLAFPFFQELFMRPVRCCSLILEYLRLAPDDPYLPVSAWNNRPRTP